MKIPHIIYGTAWKKEQTSALVTQAITAGFRGIDTAAQPKHYNEKGVGEALRNLELQGIARQEIFLQTKFTPVSGQDPAQLPYEPMAPLSVQVAQSFSSSKKNLGTDNVDSLILHSPLSTWKQMMEVWTAMETIYSQGGAKMLGISNCHDLGILKALYDDAKVKPTIVQNRFYQATFYDADLRLWCSKKNVIYQSFWTLTANPHILGSQNLQCIGKQRGKTEIQIFFRFLIQIGIIPLTGTCSEVHMNEDLEIFNFNLSNQEMETIHSILQ